MPHANRGIHVDSSNVALGGYAVIVWRIALLTQFAGNYYSRYIIVRRREVRHARRDLYGTLKARLGLRTPSQLLNCVGHRG